MKIIITKNYDEMSRKAANIIASQITLKEDSILGLATGSTPIKIYEYLIERFQSGEISFEKVKSFNLDEYVGLGINSEQSYRYFMEEKLFSKIDINKDNVRIPNGLVGDIEKECVNYESEIKDAGGIDLQLLGIGRNGHIGFNEPNVKFETTTRKVKLDDDTIEANSRFFDSINDVPTEAISMGIKTIMMSKKILLVASGKNKAEVIRDLVQGAITPALPASILQLHRDVTIVVDKEAGKLIKS